MTKDEALDLVLEIMHNQGDVGVDEWRAAEAAIKQALAAPYVATPLVQESEKRECMNCAAFGECSPNNDAGRCGYEPPAAPVQPSIKQGWDVDTLLDKPAAQRQSVRSTWVGLTDWEIKRIGKLDLDNNYFGLWYDFARAIEAKLKAKNSP